MSFKKNKNIITLLPNTQRPRHKADIKTSQAQTHRPEVKGCQCGTWNHILTQMDTANPLRHTSPPLTYRPEDANWIGRDDLSIHHDHQEPRIKHPNGHGNRSPRTHLGCHVSGSVVFLQSKSTVMMDTEKKIIIIWWKEKEHQDCILGHPES